MNIQQLTTFDQHSYQLRCFSIDNQQAAIAIIFPAMSVEASYYDNFAKAMNAAGMHAVIHELRGVGSSSCRPKSGDNFGYVDLIETDWSATLGYVASAFPESKRLIVGNSLGGQLSALHLAHHPEAADALALIASCSVYYKAYGKKAASTLVGTQTMNLAGKALGYVPGKKLGFAGDEAKDLITDWAQQARTGNYTPKGAPIDYEAAMGELTLPVLAHPVSGDWLAPEHAVKHLVGKLPASQLTFEVLSAEPLGLERLSHFSWGKRPGKLADNVAAWFHANA